MRSKTRRKVWRVLCLAVAAALVLGVALPAFASPGVKIKHQKRFFLDEDNAAWAKGYMATANVKGLLRGDPDGKFRPNDPLRRAELVAAAIRFMNQEQAALGWRGGLEFEDSAEVEARFSWAKGYLGHAAELSLVPEDGRFNPGGEASRLWATELLVKALGLDEEAQSRMGAVLDFVDATEIPRDKVGYVAVALENGLLTGYGDGTFQPNRILTRAELAALLQRADERRQWLRECEVRGTVHEVACDGDEWSITLDMSQAPVYSPDEDESEGDVGDESTGDATGDQGGSASTGESSTPSPELKTFEVSRDALVIVNGEAAGLDDVEAGYHARLVLNTSGVAILVEARAAAKPPVPRMKLKGYLVDLPDLEGTQMYGLIPGLRLGMLKRWAENEVEGEQEENEDQDEVNAEGSVQSQGEVGTQAEANAGEQSEVMAYGVGNAGVEAKVQVKAKAKGIALRDLGELLARQDRERARSMLGALGVLTLIPANSDIAAKMEENLGQFVVVTGHSLKGPNIFMRPVFKVYEIERVELGELDVDED